MAFSSNNNTPMALTLECNIHSFFSFNKKSYEKRVGGEQPKGRFNIYIDHSFEEIIQNFL
jgi:hypothetical protein